MPHPLILVTGAAGKTGRYVVTQLLEQGFPVRAMVRQQDERSEQLQELGAEIVLGAFHDLASMRSAMAGAQRTYFCYPPQGDKLVEATTIAAIAARDAGIETFVNMSQITAREDARSALSRQHWLSEVILDQAELGAIHIRPTFFAEMLVLLGAGSIASEGKLYLPYGGGRHAPVSAADIARVVVGLLTRPEGHAGQRYVLTGPRNMDIAEMAEVLSLELGREITYVDLPNEVFGEALSSMMPPFLVQHLQAVAKDHKDDIFSAETDVVERIGGRAPQSLASFIRQHRAAFESGVAEAVGVR